MVQDVLINLSGTNLGKIEINLDLLDGISFDKGCFIGQEVNARIKWKGLVKNKYVPIKFKFHSI